MENVLIYRDFDRARNGLFKVVLRLFPLQACPLAVKLDFITGLLQKSLECTGVIDFVVYKLIWVNGCV